MPYEPKPFKIHSIKKYTDDVHLLRVKTNMNPLPGQFFQLSVLGKGECPLASCSSSKEYVDILVREIGNVTAALFKLKKGETIYIRGPYGKSYDINEFKGKDLILIGGGTGIAPITSLIEYLALNRKDFGNITIFFSFRDDSRILLGDRIKAWQKHFNVVLCLGKKSSKVKSEVGHANDFLTKYVKDFSNSIAILCGPEPMMLEATKKFNELGIPDTKVYWNMERRMECAVGSCGRCLLQGFYVCKDGPIFKYSDIKDKLKNESQ